MRKIAGAILGAMMSLSLVREASACAFHGYVPDPTLVDLLLATEQVVIAGLDPARQDKFRAETVLMGPDAGDIPMEVPARTRADLLRDPNARILLARDGAYGAWLELALLDDTFEGVIRQVITQQSAWQLGGDEARLRVFAAHVNAANPELRQLALRELDRAPYAALRKERLPKVRGLRQDLQTGSADLMPIRVLLAGLSGDQSLVPLLRGQMAQAMATELPYLGAYATALMELQGGPAVEEIVTGPLATGGVSPEVEEKLLQALALQYKSGAPATRRAIAQGVAGLVRQAPHLREAAGRHFGYRNHWSLTQTGKTGGSVAPEEDR